jgi:hypothetical protein
MRAERIEQLEKRNRQLNASRKAIVAGQAAGTVIGSLVEIMLDPAHSTRARLQAAENLLAYKTPPDVAESAKVFLTSIFTDPEQNIDHRLQATKALRSSEDVRIMPPIERPARTDDFAKAEEKPIPLKELVAQRRAYCDSLTDKIAREMGLRLDGNSGNGSDD